MCRVRAAQIRREMPAGSGVRSNVCTTVTVPVRCQAVVRAPEITGAIAIRSGLPCSVVGIRSTSAITSATR